MKYKRVKNKYPFISTLELKTTKKQDVWASFGQYAAVRGKSFWCKEMDRSQGGYENKGNI